MGQEFGSNAVSVFAERETEKGHMRLTGFAGLPTFNRATAQMQYLFVNGRPVKTAYLMGQCVVPIKIFWHATAIRRWRFYRA